MPPASLPVVFVHGWSVTHTNTYGGLPRRLAAEARGHGLSISVREIWLGEYVSFHDEVRVEDIARAVEAAVRRDLGDWIEEGRRFAAVTHSTGGPVMREWWERFYRKPSDGSRPRTCPMSHLVMLAPANFGSALAQLGKSRVSRLKSWFQGVEPGKGVLDWLELGSPEACSLNRSWIESGSEPVAAKAPYLFVLTGQTIDRSLYDALNSYTGELGSDGVVRGASANLNATCLRLIQGDALEKRPKEEPRFRLEPELCRAPRTAFRFIAGASHSGKRRGIMRSVAEARGARKGAEVADAILRCLSVRTRAQYGRLCDAFEAETEAVCREECVEEEDRFLHDRIFVHDRTTQVILRVSDSEGRPVDDFDLFFTGDGDHPEHLPPGFFLDRQRNSRRRNTITYFLDYDVLVGCPAIEHGGKRIREAQPGLRELGLHVSPRPCEGFVHYADAGIRASGELADQILLPHRTVLVDIVLRRIVHEGVARFAGAVKPGSFKRVRPGKALE